MSRRPHFLKSLVDAPAEGMALCVEERDQIVARALESAFDSSARNRGLLGRTSLADERALIIAPCSAIHTFRMQFAIDVIYAARDGRVVKLRRGLGPSRLSGAFGAFAVIEMAAGGIDRAAVCVGEHLVVRDVHASPAPAHTD